VAATQVAVAGSLNADLTLPVHRLPRPGETVLTSGPAELAFGGKGANQAAAAAAFGGQVAMIGRVGADDVGGQILADLAARGIDASGVLLTDGERTGTAMIAVDEAGENLIVVDPGANRRLEPRDIAVSSLSHAAVVLVQLEIPLPTVRAAVRASRGLVVLNPAPAVRIEPALLECVSVLVPNRSELAFLAGDSSPGTLDGIAALARKLAARTDVVVTLAAGGALVVPRGGGPAVHVAAPPVDVVDGTGAGDCFCGVLAVLLAEGADLTDAARAAVAAASISTTGRGARGRLPARAEAERLAAGLPTRQASATGSSWRCGT
jgi:ribokinase